MLLGHGEFTYANGNVESAEWENGARHGLARFISTNGNTVEESMFWEGVPDGPATMRSADEVEEFTYVNGLREGSAIRKLGNGDTLQYTYEKGEIHGQAILERTDGSKEERSYVDGRLEGQAILHGVNGDRLEFTYANGQRFGAMTYFFANGSIERSFYDDRGEQSGPTQFTWPNGAKREGHKVKGKWEGQAFYLFSEGPRKGKRDVETWKEGELVSSKKYYGGMTIQKWEDLEKLQSAGTESNSPEKDVFYDCISNDD